MYRSQSWRLAPLIVLMCAFGTAGNASAAAAPAAGQLANLAAAVNTDARTGDLIEVGRRHRGRGYRGHRHYRGHGHRHRHRHHRRWRGGIYVAPFIGGYGYSNSCYRNCRWRGNSRRYCQRRCW